MPDSTDTRTPGQILHDLLYTLFHSPQSTVTTDLVEKANAAAAAITVMTGRIDSLEVAKTEDGALLTAHGDELDDITAALRDFAAAPGAPASEVLPVPAADAPAGTEASTETAAAQPDPEAQAA